MSSSIDSVSSTSSSSFVFELNQTKAKQNKQNWDDLSSALESGDLSAAKTALDAIKSSLPSNVSGTSSSSNSSSDSTSTSTSNSDNPFAKDLQTLSDAIDSGDLEGAKSALSNIQSHMKAGGQRPPPPPDGASSSSDSSNASSTDTLSALLKLLEDNSSDSSGSTSSTTDLSTLIAYLSNGSATTNTASQTGSQLTTQA